MNEEFVDALNECVERGGAERLGALVEGQEARFLQFMERTATASLSRISTASMQCLLQIETRAREDLFASMLFKWLPTARDLTVERKREMAAHLRLDLLSRAELRRIQGEHAELMGDRAALDEACAKAAATSASRRSPPSLCLLTQAGVTRSFDLSRHPHWSAKQLPRCFSDELAYSALLQVGGRLFFLGGYDDPARSDKTAVRVLDLQSLDWSLGPPLSVARSLASAVHFQEHIFLLGGRVAEGLTYLPCIEKWRVDAPEAEWQRLPDMPLRPSEPAATVLSDGRKSQIFLVSTCSTKLCCFDGVETWSEKADLPFKLQCPYMVGCEASTRLYLFGSWQENKAAVYEALEDRWSEFQFTEAFWPPFWAANRLTFANDSFYALKALKHTRRYVVMQFSLESQKWKEVANSSLSVDRSEYDQMHPVSFSS